jgi:ornithine decarboxylase
VRFWRTWASARDARSQRPQQQALRSRVDLIQRTPAWLLLHDDPMGLEKAELAAPSRSASREWELVRRHGSPLLVLDCERVRAQYEKLSRALPGVDLHYAVKALSHPAVVATLAELGSFFDVSTSGELSMLRSLELGGRRVIHTHPIKRDRDIRDALDFGCDTFVADNTHELAKLALYRDRLSVLLRVGFRAEDAVVDLAKKFGCAPEATLGLLEHGLRLGLRISGLSFHVGSQCASSHAHVRAIEACCELMREVSARGLPALGILDIGGGFPASYRVETLDIETFCRPIREALAKMPPNIRIIAEPGRYLAAPAMQSIASVIGKAKRGGVLWYYLDDGVYGSFSGTIYDRAQYPLTIVPARSGPHYPSVLAGPTCDSVDVVAEGIDLPELEIGDLVVAGAMGAYTACSASEFNSIPKTKILVQGQPSLASR